MPIKMHNNWRIQKVCKEPKLNKPILIEGLPGIGNVGKVSVDFLIDELEATKLYEINSYSFPHSVFINENNLVELPVIEAFYKKFNDRRNDILLIAGDVQPVDEISSYEFSEEMLRILEKFQGSELITLGGIGLSEIPRKPKVYCTGNSKKIVGKYITKNVSPNLYGVIGPIIGVSGLLVGLATRHSMDAVSLLAETYNHPMYLGIKGAKEILKVLNEKLKLHIDISKLDKEIKDVEAEIIKRTEQLTKLQKTMALKKLAKNIGETDYIG